MSNFVFEPVSQDQAAQSPRAPQKQAPMVLSVQEQRSQLIARMRAAIDRLPQRDQLQESDIAQWAGFVASTMPEQAMWHVVRAGGIGGSEIGALVRNYLGQRADHFVSAHDVVLDKLFRRLPTPQTPDMRRGIENEAMHRARFHKELACEQDVRNFQALANGKGKLGWMRYSPDDLVVFNESVTIPMAGGVFQALKGQRFLLDYKAPSSVSSEDAVSFQYVCQLNMGAALAQELDIPLAGTILSQFDWANWRLKNDFVHVNPKLIQLIKEAGSHYWDCVLRGEIPKYVQTKRLEIDSDVSKEVEPLAKRIAQLNALSSATKSESDVLRKRLIDRLGLTGAKLYGQKVAFPNTLSISGIIGVDAEKVRKDLTDKPEVLQKCIATDSSGKKKVNYDTEAMVKALEDRGVDTADFAIPSLDTQLTYQTLVDEGLDPEVYVTETLRLTVNKKVSEAAKTWVEKHFSEPSAIANESDQAVESDANTQANTGRSAMTPS